MGALVFSGATGVPAIKRCAGQPLGVSGAAHPLPASLVSRPWLGNRTQLSCRAVVLLIACFAGVGCTTDVTCDPGDGESADNGPIPEPTRPADPCAAMSSRAECCDAGCRIAPSYNGDFGTCVSPSRDCWLERDACRADEVCMVYQTVGDGGCSYGLDADTVGICVERMP